MNYLFGVLALIILAYLILRGKFDFFSVGALSLIIYNIYCIYGIVFIASHEVSGQYYYYDYISNTSYYIILSLLILLFVAIIIYDKKSTKTYVQSGSLKKYSNSYVYRSYKILTTISIIILIINIYKIGGISALSIDKALIWERVGNFYVVGMWCAMASCAYGIKNKKLWLVIFSLIPVLVHLIIGSRAYFATVIIIFLLYYSQIDYLRPQKTKKRKRTSKFLRNIKLYVLGSIGLLIVLVYKKIYELVKILDFSTIISVLMDKETYLFALRLGEARIVLSNFNYIINSQFRLDTSDVIARLLSVFPFINDFLNPTHGFHLSSIIITDLGSSYGLASNMWAESYAMFGYHGIYVIFILWIIMLKKGSDIIKSEQWYSYLLVPIIAYLAFYITRMDFVKALGNIKMLMCTVLIWWVINACITNDWRITSKK